MGEKNYFFEEFSSHKKHTNSFIFQKNSKQKIEMWGDSDNELDNAEMSTKVQNVLQSHKSNIQCGHPGCGRILTGIPSSSYESRLMTFVADTTVYPSSVIMCFCPSEAEARSRIRTILLQLQKAQALIPQSHPKWLYYQKRMENLPLLVSNFCSKKSCYDSLYALQATIAKDAEFTQQDIEEHGENLLRDFRIVFANNKSAQEKVISKEKMRRRRLG